MRKILFAFFLIAYFGSVSSQEKEKKERNWTLNGYIKDMGSYTFVGEEKQWDNLIHNRLNFKWYPHQNIKVIAEMRNRAFMGSLLEDSIYREVLFVPSLEAADDYFNLSTNVQVDNIVFHFMLDRLYFQYNKGNFEGKVGRQRINWGINTVWNPNDIFNAFSFFDFDYEERPGSDALVLRYYTGIASSIEFAGKFADSLEVFTGALMWKTNFKKYDFQVLGGLSNMNMVIGGGWAGNIKKAGFKGEGSYFIPLEDAQDSIEVFSATASLDYSFKNSLYLMGSVLYSSNGSVNPSFGEQVNYYTGNISAKYLSPYRYSVFGQVSYQFHPLIVGGAGIIGYPGSYDAFVGPMITFSLLQSLDLDFFAQVLFSEINEVYQATTQAYYLRLKYSF